MAVIPPLGLTRKVAEEIRSDMVQRIPALTPDWTNFNDHDPGIVVLTLLAGMLETGYFELNTRASELTAQYVRQRPNAVNLFKLIGYNLKRKVAATTTIRITLNTAHSLSIPIVPYFDADPTIVSTRGIGSLQFLPIERAAIPAGSTQLSYIAYQGTAGSDTFTPVPGAPDQIFQLGPEDIAYGTVKVFVGGVEWAEVESFYNSTDTDRHYVELTDEEGNVFIQFGDGVLGAVPAATINAYYITTLGAEGNLYGTGKISQLNSALLDITGTPIGITTTVRNTEDALGGEDEESVFHAKKVAPQVYAAQKRAVTKQDFNAWAEAFPGVRQAKTFDITDVGPLSFDIDYFEIKVVVIPEGGNYPTAALKKALLAYYQDLKDVPDNVEVVDPEYVPVVASFDIYVKKAYVASTVKANVQTAITNFFAPAESPAAELALGGEVEGQVLGEAVDVGKLLAAVQAVAGVSSIASYSPSSNVTMEAFQIAILSGAPVVNVLGSV